MTATSIKMMPTKPMPAAAKFVGKNGAASRPPSRSNRKEDYKDETGPILVNAKRKWGGRIGFISLGARSYSAARGGRSRHRRRSLGVLERRQHIQPVL